MADLSDFDDQTNAVYCKNLFLRNANGKIHYLTVVAGDKAVNLKLLAPQIPSTRMSFASQVRLQKHLKLSSGHVGPFGLMNDTSGNVICVLDKDIVDKNRLSFHPNNNSATVIISYKDLKKYLEHLKTTVVYVNI